MLLPDEPNLQNAANKLLSDAENQYMDKDYVHKLHKLVHEYLKPVDITPGNLNKNFNKFEIKFMSY